MPAREKLKTTLVTVETPRRRLLLATAILVATAVVYAPVVGFDFVHLDDDVYVTQNRHVQAGLTADGVAWAFTNTHASLWHPLTWLSHMLDCQLWGLAPGGHHLTNVVLHAANAVLLLAALATMTGDVGRSAIVAALFALHPLQVESVAWVAERKELLGTLFWLLAIFGYVRWVASPVAWRYALVALALVAGLMAKPTLVTLPFVLVLLDWWPLGRFGRSRPRALVVEKLPLVAIAALAGVLTFLVARRTGAAVPLAHLPLETRVANAMVAYSRYLAKTVWPTGLAVFYPLPPAWTGWQVGGAALLLAGITATVLAAARRQPWLATGWLWFAGALVPVIGLLQVGNQAMADRFAYVPLIGLFTALVWSAGALPQWRPALRTACSVAVVAVLAGASRHQVGYWRDSTSLFTHAIDVTTDNWLAHNNLGYALAAQGRGNEAVAHFRTALAIKPDYTDAWGNLGDALMKRGSTDEAVAELSAALRLRPDDPVARYHLGVALAKRGDVDRAAEEFERALRLRPDYADAHYNLGAGLAMRGRTDEALAQFSEALRSDPDHADAHNALASLLLQQGRPAEAMVHFTDAVRLKPDDAGKHYNAAVALAQLGRTSEAIDQFREAARLAPDLVEAHFNLAVILARQGRTGEAAAHAAEVVRLRPDLASRLPAH